MDNTPRNRVTDTGWGTSATRPIGLYGELQTPPARLPVLADTTSQPLQKTVPAN